MHLKHLPADFSRFVADIKIRDVVKTMRALGLDERYLYSAGKSGGAGGSYSGVPHFGQVALQDSRAFESDFSFEVRPGPNW